MVRSPDLPAAPTFWLSVHVGYACRDEGACCTAGWPIPIERPQAIRVRRAVAGGRLRAPADWLRVVPGQPDDAAGVLSVDGSGGCLFHDERRCDLQTALGPRALPSCCQHFPRECVIDARGVFVTLSNYCPTAADLLFTSRGPLEIVRGPAPVPGAAAEGLDARGTLPPLLTRGVLMDYPGLTAWEEHLVAWLGGRRNPDGRWLPEQTLHLLESTARSLSSWRPGAQSLAGAVAAFAANTPVPDAENPRWDEEAALRAVARRSLPSPHTWPDDPVGLADLWRRAQPSWAAFAPVINRFLAVHAFASWMAYQGDGVLSSVRRLRLALAVLRTEVAHACAAKGASLNEATLTQAIRQTDLLLVHLVDREALSAALSDARFV